MGRKPPNTTILACYPVDADEPLQSMTSIGIPIFGIAPRTDREWRLHRNAGELVNQLLQKLSNLVDVLFGRPTGGFEAGCRFR